MKTEHRYRKDNEGMRRSGRTSTGWVEESKRLVRFARERPAEIDSPATCRRCLRAHPPAPRATRPRPDRPCQARAETSAVPKTTLAAGRRCPTATAEPRRQQFGGERKSHSRFRTTPPTREP